MRRQIALIGADRRNAVFLLAEVLIPALLIFALIGPDALRPGPERSSDARTLLGALAISAASIGAANALREIVKERAIYLRERAAGLSRGAYLASKVVVVGGLTVGQSLLLVVIATSRAGGPSTGAVFPGRIELVADVALASVAAVGLGLLVSAVVSTSEKAMALIAVIFIVQWLFSGAATDLGSKPVIRQASYLTASNWGLAASASTSDLPALDPCGAAAPPRGQPGAGSSQPASCDGRWPRTPSNWLGSMIALTLLTVVTLAGAVEALARKEPAVGATPAQSLRRRFKGGLPAGG